MRPLAVGCHVLADLRSHTTAAAIVRLVTTAVGDYDQLVLKAQEAAAQAALPSV